MEILQHAASYKGQLSQAAINTFGEVVKGVIEEGSKSPWDKANSSMRNALMNAKRNSKSKAEFLVNAKKETGIAKNSHPLLVWCVANWKF